MKVLKYVAAIVILVIMSRCDSANDVIRREVTVPTKFTVEIPSSISSRTGALTGRTAGDGDGIIEGDEIYESLRYFINIGEKSAEIVEFTLVLAAALEVQNVDVYSFDSDEDGRSKTLELFRNVTRGGIAYEYEMTLTDEDAGELALQLLWNNSPVEGVAILRPFYIDRVENVDEENAFLRIDYSENDPTYESSMLVSISGLQTLENGDIDNFKMFAGRNGDVVEVMGNSNHPNLTIIDEGFSGGRNYAFVGRGDESTDLGVVKLALPPSAVSTGDVLEQYSVFSVLEEEIRSAGITDQDVIDAILIEAKSPAYFNSAGFITSGVENKPASFSDTFVDLGGMNPFVPSEVKNLTIDFIR